MDILSRRFPTVLQLEQSDHPFFPSLGDEANEEGAGLVEMSLNFYMLLKGRREVTTGKKQYLLM